MDTNSDLEKGFSPNISRITEKDRNLYEEHLTRSYQDLPSDVPISNYENSFEYIRMYFNLGKFQGYKFCDGST